MYQPDLFQREVSFFQRPVVLPSASKYSCINIGSLRPQTLLHIHTGHLLSSLPTRSPVPRVTPSRFPSSWQTRPGPLNRISGSGEKHEFSLGRKHTVAGHFVLRSSAHCGRVSVHPSSDPFHLSSAGPLSGSSFCESTSAGLRKKKPKTLYCCRLTDVLCPVVLPRCLLNPGAAVSLLCVLLRNSDVLVVSIFTKNLPDCFQMNKQMIQLIKNSLQRRSWACIMKSAICTSPDSNWIMNFTVDFKHMLTDWRDTWTLVCLWRESWSQVVWGTWRTRLDREAADFCEQSVIFQTNSLRLLWSF